MVHKISSNKPNKTPLSREERNTEDYILGGIVKIVINDKKGSKKNKVSYGYYTKLIKYYKTILSWLNKKNIKYCAKVFEKKCAYVPTDYPITASAQTKNTVTASVTYANPVTASLPSINTVTSSAPTDNYVTAYITTDYPIAAYIPTENHVTASLPCINTITVYFPTDN